jgi:hypothetical protein
MGGGTIMFTATLIRRFIFSLAKDYIFTTRQCLIYGPRSAVDYTLHMLVKKEVILRLARGVFVRNDGQTPQFSPSVVATVKAMAFGKEVFSHASTLRAKFSLNGEDFNSKEHTFAVNGSTSSFKYGQLSIHLKHIGPRKARLQETKAGQALRLLWDLKKHLNQDLIMKVTRYFSRSDREELRRSLSTLPAWLSNSFMHNVRWLPAI